MTTDNNHQTEAPAHPGHLVTSHNCGTLEDLRAALDEVAEHFDADGWEADIPAPGRALADVSAYYMNAWGGLRGEARGSTIVDTAGQWFVRVRRYGSAL